jgi:hypothetical protein
MFRTISEQYFSHSRKTIFSFAIAPVFIVKNLFVKSSAGLHLLLQLVWKQIPSS